MQSKAPDVDTYLQELPAERRPLFEKLRSLCRKRLTGYEETMEHGMPGYKRDGQLEVSFANQKQHITLYVLKKEVVDEFRDELASASIGKGSIRFSKPEHLDFNVIGRLLSRAAESQSKAC